MSTQQPSPTEPLLDEEKQQEKEEKKQQEDTMELELYGIKCAICEEKYDADKVFICKHLECAAAGNCDIHCEDCGVFKHRKKAHKFQPSAIYVVCIQDLYRPDQTNFQDANEKAKIVLNMWKVERFLFHHRWTIIGGVTIASAVISAASTGAVACAAEPLSLGVGAGFGGSGGAGVSRLAVGAGFGGIGAAFATGIESAFIFRQWYLGRITTKQAWILVGISLLSNGSALGGAVGGAAAGAKIGALLGVAGGPVGIFIGIAGGAFLGLLCGFLVRYGLNKWFEVYFKDKHKLEQKLVEEALKLFFDDKNYDIEDKKKFNDKLLRRRYRKLALIHHPEREGGDRDEWLKLSSYYGILIGIWEKKAEESMEINSSDDLNEEQLSLVLNEAIRADANLFQN